MLALLQFGHDHRQINMPFEDFLFSGFVSTHARAATCDPEDLIRDHLPAFDPDDEEETREAFREACEQATDGWLPRGHRGGPDQSEYRHEQDPLLRLQHRLTDARETVGRR